MYLGFVGSHIINIAVGSNVIPYSIKSIKIADKLQSSLSAWIRTAGAEIGCVKIWKIMQIKINYMLEIGTRKHLCTASMNLARMTDSICDSASVNR